MFIKNLLRRKVRTLLTVLGISIGVAAIVALGAMADGLEMGYNSMLSGSKADLILSQPNTMDISFSSIDESIGAELLAMPETTDVAGMIQGWAQTGSEPFFFIFGHQEGSFAMERFIIIEGIGLDSREAGHARGKPILLGSSAAESLEKSVGDTVRVTGSVFRVVGIYETGDALEDGGAVLSLPDAQDLVGKPRQVSVYYIKLKDPSLGERLVQRVDRKWPNLSLSGVDKFSEDQIMADMLRGYVWVIGGLAIIIGGISMMNAQLMAVYERTREIGVLRAVGWSRRRILMMILSETMTVSLLGGLAGLALGWSLISWLSGATVFLGVSTENISTGLLIQAIIIVMILGLVGGLYPALRASRLRPIEALRYEGGSSGGKARRFPIGGMTAQSLWQRSARTFLTLGVIGITVGAIIALEGIMDGFAEAFTQSFMSDTTEIMIRQADIADTSLSAIDERIGDKIAAMPEVESASGLIFTALMQPDTGGFFILQGYAPNELAIRRFRIVEGHPLSNNHQVILGRSISESLNKDVGDTIELNSARMRVVGIYESDLSWEELGGVVTLRDAQNMIGRPHKAGMYALSLYDPSQAQVLVDKINTQFPEIHAALASDFVEQMPDMENSDAMINGIAIMAIVVGGMGVLNTMLMAVFERTREIGVLRALGWRQWAILGMILREALLLGLLGGLAGIGIALGLTYLLRFVPMVGEMLTPKWDWIIFGRAILTALFLGLLGGLYPAFRATRLQPIEALRYE